MPLPALAPVAPIGAICGSCGNLMRLDVEKFKNGKLSKIMLYCDTCKYGHEPSMVHVTGNFANYKEKKEEVGHDFQGS